MTNQNDDDAEGGGLKGITSVHLKNAEPIRQPPGIDLIDKIANALAPQPARPPRFGDKLE
jgi:hypothetical protein